MKISIPVQDGRLTDVTIAIPVWQNRVSPVLDAAARLLVVRRRQGVESGRREVVLGPLPVEVLASAVAGLHIDILICAALSEPLRLALEQLGVSVRPHLCGDVDQLLRAFGSDRLNGAEFRMPGCGGRHTQGAFCRRLARARESSCVPKTKRPRQ
jgi:predicted Fe-Mo cluster-binding NifX family protein